MDVRASVSSDSGAKGPQDGGRSAESPDKMAAEPVSPDKMAAESGLPDVLINGQEMRKGDGCARRLLVEKPEAQDENMGFNLTRSQWDPYPWVRSVDWDSAAGRAGLKEGDCLIRVGQHDLLGLKVSEVARLLRATGRAVQLLVWSCGPSEDWDPEALFCGPLPGALRRLGACLGAILRAAECPVCTATVTPPALQCARGHLLCARCRARLPACPLCRAPLSPLRNLLADEVYNCVVESFELKPGPEGARLTRALLGEGARFTRRSPERAGFPEHDGPKAARWGTQRLLERLLPGRARSTGNIARSRSPSGSSARLAEERDISRSLSNLDVARNRAQHSAGSSLASLACAGGSCNSLPSTIFHGAEADEAGRPEVSAPPSSPEYHCPSSASCAELVTGDLHQHAVERHGQQLLLRPGAALRLDRGRPAGPQAVLHLEGCWFYPKCERDASDTGVRVWCWVAAAGSVSSLYRISVEVWPEARGGAKRDAPSEATEDSQAEGCSAADVEKGVGPLLKYVAPVLSLEQDSWQKVLASEGLFLGDRLLEGNAEVRLAVDRAD